MKYMKNSVAVDIVLEIDLSNNFSVITNSFSCEMQLFYEISVYSFYFTLPHFIFDWIRIHDHHCCLYKLKCYAAKQNNKGQISGMKKKRKTVRREHCTT